MIRIGDNLREFEAALSDAMLEQLPFAMSQALNDTAFEIATQTIPMEMRQVFDNPTRFTLQAFRFNRATKRDLVALILPKDRQGGRHYLYIQHEGGARQQTGLERLLSSRLNYGGVIYAVTPASGMRLDGNGNMSRGQLNQIISAIQANRDRGANTTAASRARNMGRAQYFVPRDGSSLSPGVWMRTAGGQLIKVLHFTTSMPTYRPRFDFDGVAARRGLEIFPRFLSARLEAAWASRRR
jgi:hypothetical protein